MFLADSVTTVSRHIKRAAGHITQSATGKEIKLSAQPEYTVSSSVLVFAILTFCSHNATSTSVVELRSRVQTTLMINPGLCGVKKKTRRLFPVSGFFAEPNGRNAARSPTAAARPESCRLSDLRAGQMGVGSGKTGCRGRLLNPRPPIGRLVGIS